ncbi:glycoside hydrolase superfamily [Staphylotrichum tortipilum]|uniref:Alpha-galactosidase n=1 Tax=Staphylotrichum tortipilum TaxID=2831512 RepID=A0AAN6MCY1_9PEZI|nr:glycoside hydrolase superfamily [Staphylotrichum longicolle]
MVWNVAQCNSASASYALSTANAFISLGLKDLGYTYINIDDCWSTLSRNSSGYLVPDPAKWPNGIKPVVDQIHSMGLKFGLYGCAGTKTCGGYPGSQGYEVKDAQTLAAWGVDYWKYDNCFTPCNGPVVQTCGSPAGNTQTWYATMHNALQSVSRPIFFSLCQWGRDNVWTWGANYGNSWRMSVDNWNDWASVVRIASAAAGISQYSAPGGFNDLDMMQVGNGKLTAAEERTHFGLWAMAKSPIILGNDLSKISSATLAIVKNKGILAINQDPLGKAATYFQPRGAAAPVSGQIYPYWAGPLTNGVAVGLVAASGAQTLSVNFADVPGLGAGTWNWVEYYTGKTGTGTSVSFALASHDMAILKVTNATSGSTSSASSTTLLSSSTTTTTAPRTTQTHYGQCGGIGWTGPTACETPYGCKYSNDWYSQCL